MENFASTLVVTTSSLSIRQNGDILPGPPGGHPAGLQASPQTLQQLTGSPGRARDRNLFYSPPTASVALALPALRGCYPKWLRAKGYGRSCPIPLPLGLEALLELLDPFF